MKPIKWILLVALMGLIFGLFMASGTAEGQGLSISGHKYTDVPDKKGLEGWTIYLEKKGKDGEYYRIADTVTDSKGSYKFDNLEGGKKMYRIKEEPQDGWRRFSPGTEYHTAYLTDQNVANKDFINRPESNTTCNTGCPWYIKNELYRAECGELLEIPASMGILANDPKGTTVIDPELITIDPKYGTLEVYEDGSFDYDPDPSIHSGTYVVFYYTATNGVCEGANKGLAKIQVAC